MQLRGPARSYERASDSAPTSRIQLARGALGKAVANTRSPTPFLARFALDDAVRLLDSHDDVPAGSVGRVLGTFPRPTEITYVVSFVDTEVHVLELRAHEIVLVDDFSVAA